MLLFLVSDSLLILFPLPFGLVEFDLLFSYPVIFDFLNSRVLNLFIGFFFGQPLLFKTIFLLLLLGGYSVRFILFSLGFFDCDIRFCVIAFITSLFGLSLCSSDGSDGRISNSLGLSLNDLASIVLTLLLAVGLNNFLLSCFNAMLLLMAFAELVIIVHLFFASCAPVLKEFQLSLGSFFTGLSSAFVHSLFSNIDFEDQLANHFFVSDLRCRKGGIVVDLCDLASTFLILFDDFLGRFGLLLLLLFHI